MNYHDLWCIRQWIIIDLESPEPPKELDPYQKLLLAIFMDAVETLKKPPKAIVNRYIGKRQYKVKETGPLDPISDARYWLMSDDDSILGFCSICEYLHWEPSWIRKKALEGIDKARAIGDKPGNVNRHLALPGPRSRKCSRICNATSCLNGRHSSR